MEILNILSNIIFCVKWKKKKNYIGLKQYEEM